MMNRRLKRIKSLPAGLADKLDRKGIRTSKDFLTHNPLELMNILNLTYLQLQDMVSAVSKATAPCGNTVLSISQGRMTKYLPTSLAELDSILKGGLPPSTLTEISGPPGCGKTQFCIMLSAVSALPKIVGGRGSPVIYIDTEGAFSAERLIEIARCHCKLPSTTHTLPSGCTSPPPPLSPPPHSQTETIESYLLELASSVHIYKELTCDDFLECLDQLDVIIAKTGAGLVVVDSIASLVRKEYDMATMKGVLERTNALMKQASRLKYLAESFDIHVVVTNQIVSQLSHDREGDLELGENEGVVTTPALGNAWYHSVNIRLLLDYRDEQQRELTILKSPLCARESISVTIRKRGLSVSSNHCKDDEDDSLTTGFYNAAQRGFPIEFPGK